MVAGLVLAWPEPQPIQLAGESQTTAAPRLERHERTSRELNRGRPPLKAVTPKPVTPATKRAAPRPSAKTSPTPTPSVPKVVGSKYATANVNVRSDPSTSSRIVSTLSAGSEVPVTSRTEGEWVQVLLDGKPGWVKQTYLSTEKPAESEEPEDGISQARCDSGSDVEQGLTPDAVRVHRALCARFTGIKSYGGMRGGGGEHSQGRAVDVMIGTDQSLGEEIARWVRAHHEELGVSEVIWAQRIWTVERSGDGWRSMEDRGSPTANHYDHVHVTVYGNSGG